MNEPEAKGGVMRSPVRNCRRLGRGSDLEHPKYEARDANYPTATSDPYYHHEQQQRYSLRSASAVTEARIFPFTINYVHIECGPLSLLPGG